MPSAKPETKGGPLAEQLRWAVRSCGLSFRKIAEDAQIEQASISRLMSGQGLQLEKAAALLDYFGFEIKPPSEASLRRMGRSPE